MESNRYDPATLRSNSYFLEKLNDNCEHRDTSAKEQWEEEDMVDNRNYCYSWYKEWDFCTPCRNTMAEFRCQQDKIDLRQNKIDVQNDILNRLDELMKDMSAIKDHLGIY